MSLQARKLLEQLFHVAVGSAQANECLARHLPAVPDGRTIVIGAGKASAAMAQTLEEHWPTRLQGLVITPYGYSRACRQIEIIEAAHPLPDSTGQAASQRMLQLVQGLSANDLVIALFSGGGSSLLSMPATGIRLADKQAVHAALLNSGASIAEINCVRRHLSMIKGGRLALACAPARICNLLISDVPGDIPYDIASGPVLPDPSSRTQALEILQRYRITPPDSVTQWLNSAAAETVKPGDHRLPPIDTRVLATAQTALDAAAMAARQAGVTPWIMSDRMQGEAREVAKVLAAIALQLRLPGQLLSPPCVLLSGGETSVTVRGQGSGGRNTELLLSLAIALDGAPGIHALAADTDGIDGGAGIAGALISPDSLQQARQLGMSPLAYLDNNDSHSFFQSLKDTLITGPTYTNVNDFRAILLL